MKRGLKDRDNKYSTEYIGTASMKRGLKVRPITGTAEELRQYGSMKRGLKVRAFLHLISSPLFNSMKRGLKEILQSGLFRFSAYGLDEKRIESSN